MNITKEMIGSVKSIQIQPLEAPTGPFAGAFGLRLTGSTGPTCTSA